MFWTSLKIAYRNLLSGKGFALINIFGLAIGMAACLSIFYYTAYEFSYDDFQPEAERTYRLIIEREAEGEIQEMVAMPGLYGDELLQFEEIEERVRFYPTDYQNNVIIVYDDADIRSANVRGVYYADPDFWKITSFPVIDGNIDEFSLPHRIVLTEETAVRLFGSNDVAGRRVVVSNNIGKNEFVVAAVLENLPTNTEFNFNVLLSMASLPEIEGAEILTNPDQYSFWTYFLFAEGANVAAMENEVMPELIPDSKEIKWRARFVPLRDLHWEKFSMNIPGDKNSVYALLTIGIFILALAWINYVNLSITRAMERAKEVGVRKVMGAGKRELRLQFLVEALILNLVAALLAFTLVQAALPFLRQFGNAMEVSVRQMPWFILLVLGVLGLGTVMSSLYPSMVMSVYRSVDVIKGSFKNKSENILLRKVLVVFQFTISILLIIGTYSIYTQVRFMKNMELGVNLEQSVVIQAPPGALTGNDYVMNSRGFKNSILGLSFVDGMTATSSIPGIPTNWGAPRIRRPGDDSELIKMVDLIACDADYLKTLQIDLLAGRHYAEGDNTFGKGDIIINERALEQFGFESPEAAIGEKLEGGDMFGKLTIIGVVENYHHLSAQSDFEPTLYVLSIWANYFVIRLSSDPSGDINNIHASIDELSQIWHQYFPEAPFDYFFLDEKFNQQYKADERFNVLFSVFAGIGILIAILGLIGLSSYEVFQRTKEIGIRKVLGASTTGIVLHLSRIYILLVLVSGLIAIPISYLGIRQWLAGYSFQTELNVMIFLLPVIGVCVLAFALVIFQVRKAASINPAISLKYE